MLYDYIKENYEVDEPIFLSELPGKSKEAIRQEMKKLVDEGKLSRFYNGVYFLKYTNVFGQPGSVSFKKYIEKKFLRYEGKVSGYITGLGLVNRIGLTTQNPAIVEIASNQATTGQRKIKVAGRKAIVYQPLVKIEEDNVSTLQFLDLMKTIDKYVESDKGATKRKLDLFVEEADIDFQKVKEYLPLYPDRVYRNLYVYGLMKRLL